MVDDSDARVASEALWQDLGQRIGQLGALAFADDTPGSPEHRAVVQSRRNRALQRRYAH